MQMHSCCLDYGYKIRFILLCMRNHSANLSTGSVYSEVDKKEFAYKLLSNKYTKAPIAAQPNSSSRLLTFSNTSLGA